MSTVDHLKFCAIKWGRDRCNWQVQFHSEYHLHGKDWCKSSISPPGSLSFLHVQNMLIYCRQNQLRSIEAIRKHVSHYKSTLHNVCAFKCPTWVSDHNVQGRKILSHNVHNTCLPAQAVSGQGKATLIAHSWRKRFSGHVLCFLQAYALTCPFSIYIYIFHFFQAGRFVPGTVLNVRVFWCVSFLIWSGLMFWCVWIRMLL